MNRIVGRVVLRHSAAAMPARRWTTSVLKPQFTQRESPLPLSAMPGPSAGGWPHLVQVLRRGGLPRIHQISQEDFDTYGPVYRQKLGSLESVNVLLPSDAARVFGVEGSRPDRQLVDSWMEYRKHRRRSLGVLLQSGDEWWNRRSALNRELLAPPAVRRQAAVLAAVSRDFAARLRSLSSAAGDAGHVAGLENELFKFALESVCSALFGERLGLLNPVVPPQSQRFIDAISAMFHSTVPMLVAPARLHRALRTPTWRSHTEAWDVIFTYADRWIQKSLLSFRASGGDGGGRAHHESIMANLLQRDSLSLEDLAASVTELMAGGVDTTSITLLWALMELSRDPSLQEELRSEVTKAMTPGADPTEVIRLTPLIRLTLTETLRLHPVALSVQRYIADDVIIQNYLVPRGTLVQVGIFAMGRHSAIFPEPERFCPQRWARQTQDTGGEREACGITAAGGGAAGGGATGGGAGGGGAAGGGVGSRHHFQALSFGFGPRQCLGRRLAMMEMHLLLAHVLRDFRVTPFDLQPIGTKFDLILTPDRPIRLNFNPVNPRPS